MRVRSASIAIPVPLAALALAQDPADPAQSIKSLSFAQPITPPVAQQAANCLRSITEIPRVTVDAAGTGITVSASPTQFP